MTQRMGSKGQVVIPKEIRDRLGLHPGSEVVVTASGDAALLTARHRPRPLAGRFNRSGMAARLLADRAAEPR